MVVSGFGQSLSSSTYTGNVNSIAQRLSDLTSTTGRQAELATNIQNATSAITNSSTNQQPQNGTADRFYQRKDPTILFGNIQAGFESDFNDPTQVRLQDQGMSIIFTREGEAYTALCLFLGLVEARVARYSI